MHQEKLYPFIVLIGEESQLFAVIGPTGCIVTLVSTGELPDTGTIRITDPDIGIIAVGHDVFEVSDKDNLRTIRRNLRIADILHIEKVFKLEVCFFLGKNGGMEKNNE